MKNRLASQWRRATDPGHAGDAAPCHPEGLVLSQTISVDENYMFTITQRAQNGSGETLTLYPFGQIARTGTPQLTDLFILHEGPIGFFGEEGLTEIDYDDLLSDGPVKQSATGGWLGITDKYWAAALIPPQDQAFTGRFTGRADDRLGGQATPSIAVIFCSPDKHWHRAKALKARAGFLPVPSVLM